MKRLLLSANFLILTSVGFSQAICPSLFTRNNGNKGSTCASHIKLSFTTCPTTIPTLDSIKINGVLQPETFTLFEQKCSGSNIYVDYCISDDNLPPAAQITMFLTFPDGATGGTGGSIICNVPSGGPTPVILTDFSAQRDKSNNVDIVWKTQQEINSSRFEIEISYDNVVFEKIATISAAGNSNLVKSYSYTDISNNSTKSCLYRIKMIDIDGSFTYSAIKSIKASTEPNADFSIYPNPAYANSKITIGQLNGPAVVKFFDLSGRVVKSVSLQNTNSTEINDLHKGTYLVQITDKNSGSVQVKKLSVVN
jgi:hypothetical protein